MLNILRLKHSQRETHIVKGHRKGKKFCKTSLCGYKFKKVVQKGVFEGGPEFVTCERCLRLFNLNIEVFTKK